MAQFSIGSHLVQAFRQASSFAQRREVQGFGIVKGRGLEVVLTLGTGASTAVFRDGLLMPHLELAQHPIHDN